MMRSFTSLVIISFLCHLVTASETIEKKIEYTNKVLLEHPRFFDDNLLYALCNEKRENDEGTKCQVAKISNIFGKNHVTKKCDILVKFKTDPGNKYTYNSNEYLQEWLLASLGADHVVVKIYGVDDVVIVRFEDCKYLNSSLHDSQAAELSKTFKELGIYPDEIFKGGVGIFGDFDGELHATEGFNKKGNDYWYHLYGRTTYANEAKKSFHLSKTENSKYYLYTKRGELKPISWDPDYSWRSVDVGSAAHDYVTVHHNQRGGKKIIKQLDQDGQIKSTYEIDAKKDPILAIHNLPEGGFYLLTPRNSTDSAPLTKVNVKGEGTHVLDVENVKYERNQNKQGFNFYENKERQLCLSWVYYDSKESTGTIDFFSKCFNDVKIS